MPKGAKKRKAAKKKKQQDAPSSTNPLGNDDVKTQDEKDSDGGELGSPASQEDHHGQHPFAEGVEDREKREDQTLSQYTPVEEVKEGDGEGIQEYVSRDNDVESYKESKYIEGSEIKNIIIEQVESAKESQNGHESSSSSSSNSDEDSQVALDKKRVKEKIFNSVVESPQIGDSVKLVESLAEDIPMEKIYNSTAEDVHILNPVKQSVLPFSDEVIYVSESPPEDKLLVSDAVQPGLKENEENSVPMFGEVIGVPSALMDFESKEVDKKVPCLTDGKANSFSVTVECTSEEKEVEPLPSIVIPSAGTGAEHIKDLEFPESSERKPLVASDPQAVQKTSWMSCCGLFEVLTRS